MKVLYPPQPIEIQTGQFSVFLAGSIEMGKAIDWQQTIIKALEEKEIILLNPRRPDWDSSWKQEASNPHFAEQVNWELDGLKIADLVVFYFAPFTQSPISLLELGLLANSGNAVVCCPDGFWRKGNVEIVANRFGIKMVENLYELINAISELC